MCDDENAPHVLASNVTPNFTIVDVVSHDVLGHVVVESDSMDPSFSFDIFFEISLPF